MAKSKYKVVNMEELPQEGVGVVEKVSKKKKKVEEMEFSEASLDTVQEETVSEVTEDESAEAQVSAPAKKIGFRSKRYVSSKSSLDRSKAYALSEAVALLKKVATAKFDEAVEVHLVLTESLGNLEVAYPHSTGRTLRVQILDEDTILALDKGTISFDILLATPAQMSKLTKFARLLGPKGMMPNPKNGTLISDPEKRKKDLESGKVTVRGEKKAPLLHARVGKVSMDAKALEENIQALIDAARGKVLKVVVCTSMSPGVKIQL